MSRADLAESRQPSMASVLESVVGHWGSTFISIGVVVSVLGAYLAWTLMSAEMMYIPARTDDMPKFLRRVNKVNTPIAALILTSVAIQVFLLATLTSDDALNFMLDLSTCLALIPYFLSAAYALKIVLTRDTYQSNERTRVKHGAIAGLATVYTLFLVYTAGAKFLLLSCVIYAPGTILYVMARRENARRVFGPAEIVLCGLLALGGIAGVIGLATGGITI
jgi:arginine:ornithine antiporter/lysine permease